MMGTISIRRRLAKRPGGRVDFAEPKSRHGKRAIEMSPALAIALREHYDRQGGIARAVDRDVDADDLVFSWPDGRPMLPGSVTHAFKKIARKAGLGQFHLHECRHTHASLLLQQGIHPKVVQERLGHANISITLDVYSHLTKGIQQAAALRFDAALADAIPVNPDRDSSRDAPLTIR